MSFKNNTLKKTPPGISVLLVDDDVTFHELLRYGLEKEGLSVEVAESSIEARRKLDAMDFALVVLDIGLPD